MAEIVKLDVGGTHYTVSRRTLTAHSEYFETLLSGRFAITEVDGRVFVERDGKLFRYCLRYMQGYPLTIFDTYNFPKGTINYILKDAEFYGLEGMVYTLSTSMSECGLILDNKRRIESTGQYKVLIRDVGGFRVKYFTDSDHGQGYKYTPTSKVYTPDGYALKVVIDDPYTLEGPDTFSNGDEFTFVIPNIGKVPSDTVIGKAFIVRS